MSTPPTAAQIHHYDQAHAQLADTLDAIVSAHRDTLAEGRPREAAAAAVAHFLYHDVNTQTCAELCAIAIERLTDGEPPLQEP